MIWTRKTIQSRIDYWSNWHPWFAWFPVTVGGDGNTETRVWLTWIKRKGIPHKPISYDDNGYWEWHYKLEENT